MRISDAGTILGRLIDTVSKGGFYLLNISPTADGLIPEDQQRTLLAIGAWLDLNGEGIYDTHAWTKPAEDTWRFTVKSGALYAIGLPAGKDALLASVPASLGKVTRVDRIGVAAPLAFTQDETGLRIQVAGPDTGKFPLALKITGLDLK
jgi:alpha-L-fucosidase